MFFNRAVTYFHTKEYDKAWDDVSKAQDFGWKVHPDFLNDLRNASGKKYTKTLGPDSVFSGGKVKFNVIRGDICLAKPNIIISSVNIPWEQFFPRCVFHNNKWKKM